MKQREMLGPFCSSVTILCVISSAHLRIIDQACARQHHGGAVQCHKRAQLARNAARALLCFLIFINPDYQKSVPTVGQITQPTPQKWSGLPSQQTKVYYLKHHSKNKKKFRHVSNSLVSIYRWISIYRGLEMLPLGCNV